MRLIIHTTERRQLWLELWGTSTYAGAGSRQRPNTQERRRERTRENDFK